MLFRSVSQSRYERVKNGLKKRTYSPNGPLMFFPATGSIGLLATTQSVTVVVTGHIGEGRRINYKTNLSAWSSGASSGLAALAALMA